MNFGRILTKWSQAPVKLGRSAKKVGLSRAAKKKQRKQQQLESLVDYHSLLCCKTGDCVRSEFSQEEVHQMREEFYSLETQVQQGEFILRNVQFKDLGYGLSFFGKEVCNFAVCKILGIGKSRLQRLRHKKYDNREPREGMAFKTADPTQPGGFRQWMFTKTQHILAFLNMLANIYDI